MEPYKCWNMGLSFGYRLFYGIESVKAVYHRIETHWIILNFYIKVFRRFIP